MQLFSDDTESQNLIPFDGEVYLYKQFYDYGAADSLFSDLEISIPWKEEELLIYGKACKVPRLISWHGDVGYRYSGIDHKPNPWTPTLLSIREKIQNRCSAEFNSVLLNCYRNGQDSIGAHSDDEPELGKNPIIASLSLGSKRLFKLQHKTKNTILNIPLEHGDLLVMAGALQQYWKHSIPKEKHVTNPRINLTFRKTNGRAG